MIQELYKYSDDEIIIKMKYTELRDLCGEIYDLIHKCDKTITNPENYYLCKQLLEVVSNENT